ncbi:SprT-like domain-containing protein [Halobacterium sp. CBA1126]|uniref:SprT-like domain-containing protein n=1 Tax=Halobacterium sp. CBA1126 TaxID=2668074 RepID=UPI0012FBADF6|nr:SprT-like domain-containing protein [Halobacterium sp. CBA1126]MUV59313.1 sprT domain-containing protein [Halobacterium sp. CBA1126]
MTDATTLDTDFYAVDADASTAEFLAVAKVYARDVAESYDLSVDVSALDWEVSKRAKRRAGAVKYRGDDPETVSLTWEYFQEHGWGATADVVRHELIHVHLINEAGDASHGDAFRELAADLQTSVACERFADPNWWVVCEDCGSELPRYRKSKLVKNPDQYRCGGCGGRLSSHSATGPGD